MLPSHQRIKHKEEFEKLFRSKKTARAQSPLFTLYFARSKEAKPRFGFVVGTRVSKKATARNKLKRRMRAVIARAFPVMQTGFDAVLVARPQAERATFQEIERVLLGLLQAARLMAAKQ